MRLKLTVVYLVMVTFGFIIMLLVMTFNVGIFLTVILGLTLGHALTPKVPKIDVRFDGEGVNFENNLYQPEFEKCCTQLNAIWMGPGNAAAGYVVVEE